MTNFMIVVKNPGVRRKLNNAYTKLNEVFIPLVDFESLEDAKELENPEVVKNLYKALLPYEDSRYIDAKVYNFREYMEDHNDINGTPEGLFNRILSGTCILKDSGAKFRFIQNMDLSIHKLIPQIVMHIDVFDTKEDFYEWNENRHMIDPFMHYKKISGGLMIIKSMEPDFSEALNTRVTQTKELFNDKDPEDLGFLIEYHDCKVSTVEYVENFFSNIKMTHASVMISKDNRVLAVENTDEMIYLADLNKLTMNSYILN